MKRIRTAALAALLASTVALPTTPVAAQDNRRDNPQEDRRDRDQDRRDEGRAPSRDWRKYDYRHFEPGQRHYDAARYYRRDDRKYKVRQLGRNDRIYRGSDNRYYCRRSDGTTGLIIGGLAGGAIGKAIAPGDSDLLGAILGAGVGAAVGHSIDRGSVSCR